MNIGDILKDFMLLPGPSGYESEMAYSLKNALAAYTDDTQLDKMGNVIAKINGRNKSAPVIMIYAHMDQMGFIVRNIDSDGFIRLERLGGVPEKVLPGLNLIIRGEDSIYHPAVIGTKSHHATPEDEKYRVDPLASIFVDIGVHSSGQVRDLGIEIGCPAVYKPSFTKLSDTKVAGTAIDNRGGCAALVNIACLLSKNRPESDVYLTGTVWEEFNLRGAMLAARAVKPDIAICLDVVLAGDTPDLKGRFETKAGAGPVVMMYNFHGRGTLNGTIPHEGLVKLAVNTAKEESLPLQRFASTGILTDSSYLQLENTGVASIELGFTARYTHTPVEVCDLRDLENLSMLVSSMVSRIDGKFDLNRY